MTKPALRASIEGVDDFVFVPNGWDMAVESGIRCDPATDREALAELADAMLGDLDGPELDRLAAEATARIWSTELEEMIREALAKLAEQDDWRQPVTEALAALDRDPQAAEVTREIVCHLAMQLGQADFPHMFFCLHCLDLDVAAAPARERRRVALQAAILCAREIDPTFERRAHARERLARIGGYGRDSMPALARELCAVGEEPAPAIPEEDEVWQAVRAGLLALAAPDN